MEEKIKKLESFVEALKGANLNEDFAAQINYFNHHEAVRTLRTEQHKHAYSAHLVASGLLEVIKKILDQKADPINHWGNNTTRLMVLMQNLLYNGSEEIGRAVIQVDLHLTFLNCMRDKSVYELPTSESEERVFRLLCCCYNEMRSYPDSRLVLRKAGLVELCTHYMHVGSNDNRLTNELLFVLSYAADLDANPDALKATQFNLVYIHSILQESLQDSDHNSSIGFSAADILACILRLVKNADNAETLIPKGLVDTCNKAIVSHKNEQELQLGLETLWTLAFQKSAAEIIIANTLLIDTIKTMKKHHSEDVKAAASGILFQLNVDQPQSGQQKVSEDPEEQHVMISYCWKQKEVARELSEKFKQSGKKVWIDIEKMEGNILERMAEAIENASVIICCYSEDYKNSQACRSEAEYAFRLKKQVIYVKTQPDFAPNGWLGIMMGNALYYEIPDMSSVEEKLPEVLGRVHSIEGGTNSKSGGAATSAQTTVQVAKELEFFSWTESQVREWLHSIGMQLSDKAEKRNFDGEMLKELRGWQKECPMFFLECCKDLVVSSSPIDALRLGLELKKIK